MIGRSPPGSPIRGRFRWLRRLFRRLKHRHTKLKDTHHISDGRDDDDMSFTGDYMDSQRHSGSKRWVVFEDGKPEWPENPSDISSEAPEFPLSDHISDTFSGWADENTFTSRIPESASKCLPSRRKNKKGMPPSPEYGCTRYPGDDPMGLHKSTKDDRAQVEAEAEAAHMEVLRQQFKNKYRYLTDDPFLSNHHQKDSVPTQVLDLDGCLRNPPQSLDFTWTPTKQSNLNTIGLPGDIHQSHPVGTTIEDVVIDNEANNQKVRFSWQAEALSLKKKRVRKQKRRTRIRNKLYRKFFKPKGYKTLKETQEDRSEIKILEQEFDRKATDAYSPKRHSQSNKQTVVTRTDRISVHVSRVIGQTATRMTTSTRRISATAKDGFQQVVGGLSRLQLEMPKTGQQAYKPMPQDSWDTSYLQPEILVN